jgi:acetylglutamate kinase
MSLKSNFKFDSNQISILVEALPYLQAFKNKIVVVKYGGNAMVNEEFKEQVLKDIIFLKVAGMKPVVVHGGGPEITANLKKMGKKSEFVSGLRVTDKETIETVEMTLVGKINTNLVGLSNLMNGNAVGISGKDANLILAKKYMPIVMGPDGDEEVDIGFVGKVEKINVSLIESLVEADFIPFIAPIGVGENGETYNINADSVAGEIASALKAEKLIVLTDVKGIYEEYNNESTFISTLTFEKAKELIVTGNICDGMIPKVQACITALSGGAKKAHIVDGREIHTILTEIFSDSGVGTEVVVRKDN